MPKISILLTSYNQADFLKESIDSVLGQTFGDFELIIVDDCSTDSSMDIINSYTDARIKVFRNEKNHGPEHAFGILHETAVGEYVAIADSDNIWEPCKLEKQVAFLDGHPEYAAVFTKVKLIDEHGRVCSDEFSAKHDVFDVENRSRHEWLNYFFYKGNCLCHPSILVRRAAYAECGMIVNGLWQIPDYFKWIRLCLKHDIYIMDEELFYFRIHGGNISGSNNYDQILRANNELYHTYSLFYEISPADFALAFPDAAERFTVNGRINIKFAISRMLLDMEGPAAEGLALNTLFSMLNNSEEREEIWRLYGYDDSEFKIDETRYSPYVQTNFARELRVYDAILFLDFGQGYNGDDIIRKRFFVYENGHFKVDFKNINQLSKGRQLIAMRFDPCEECCKIEITHVASGDKSLKFEINRGMLSPSDYAEQEDADVFFIPDPSYIFSGYDYNIDELTVYGTIANLGAAEAAKLKNQEIAELRQTADSLANELALLKNSISWKITKPLRKIRHIKKA